MQQSNGQAPQSVHSHRSSCTCMGLRPSRGPRVGAPVARQAQETTAPSSRPHYPGPASYTLHSDSHGLRQRVALHHQLHAADTPL